MVAAFGLAGCDDLFSPASENNKTVDAAYSENLFAQEILGNAYARNPYNICDPYNPASFNDVATDDAVTNETGSSYLKMATGAWASNNNPMEQWASCKAAIQYVNIFLGLVDDCFWAEDAATQQMFCDRLKGEAYGLRAMYMFYLLQAHGGMTSDGRLMGVPIVNEAEDTGSEFNRPRDTFADCIKQLYADVEQAVELLPLDYHDVSSDADVPAKYTSIGANAVSYTRVFGSSFQLRMSGRIAKAYRAKAALLAASPAFADGSGVTWTDAADYNGELLDLIGGVNGLAANGLTWYANADEISSLSGGVLPAEMLWRTGVTTNGFSLEQANFPNSLYGSGRINPTQNLVDAFPMQNGYPIGNGASGYDDQNPYANRDPRLATYILCNGGTAGVDNAVINTSADSQENNKDGLNKEQGVSTRTGYYMRKHLRQDVYLSSTTQNGQSHYQPRIRYTEIFLNYAEAANEAWGPTGTGSHGYSAYDVVKAIRQRAGVGTDNGDPYLESVKSSTPAMRELIRNERRLELCFEGFRFWDLRRWNADLTEPAKGMRIENGIYTPFTVENRNYQSYMNYGPIPYSELLKFDALEQNAGW